MVVKRKYITIHCASGKPGPPFEVLADDGATPLAKFNTLAEAEAYAAEEAKKANATVILSPLARGST